MFLVGPEHMYIMQPIYWKKMGVQSFVMQAVRELSGRLIICASMNVHEQMQGPTPAQACVGHFGWVGREGASLQ